MSFPPTYEAKKGVLNAENTVLTLNQPVGHINILTALLLIHQAKSKSQTEDCDCTSELEAVSEEIQEVACINRTYKNMTELYIFMCKTSHEVQGLFCEKINRGEQVVFFNLDATSSKDHFIFSNTCNVEEFHKLKVANHTGDVIFLPGINYFVRLYFALNIRATTETLVKDFYNYFEGLPEDISGSTELIRKDMPLDVIWLAFIMKVLFNKKWDGKSWIEAVVLPIQNSDNSGLAGHDGTSVLTSTYDPSPLPSPASYNCDCGFKIYSTSELIQVSKKPPHISTITYDEDRAPWTRCKCPKCDTDLGTLEEFSSKTT